jgi:predicted RNase H-like HicB family nuclease
MMHIAPGRSGSGTRPPHLFLIVVRHRLRWYYHETMLRYHVAFSLPRAPGEMVVAEALDFPGAVTQGFDLPDARLMIASALEDLAQALLEEGKALPVPSDDAHSVDADLIELVPLSVHAGTAPR